MKISQLLLLLLFLLMQISQSEFAKYTIFFTVPLLVMLILNTPKLSLSVLSSIRTLLFLVFIALTSGLFHLLEYDMYFFFRDVIYFVQAPAIIALGAYLCVRLKGVRSILKIVVIGSFVITLFRLSLLLFQPEIILRLGLGTRNEYELANSTAILAFAVLYYARLQRYSLFRTYVGNTIIVVSLISIALSFSRTFYVTTAIILLLPYARFWKLTKATYFLSVFTIIFILFGGNLGAAKSVDESSNNLFDKFSASASEITIRSFSDAAEINHNWRGYEAFLGLQKYYKGNVAELLFGQGLGAVVRPPNWIFGAGWLSVIPMFHNGYMTILLKTGVVGLCVFFFFMYRVLIIATKHLNTSTTSRGRVVGLLGQACIFSILFQTLVVHGLFATTAPFMLLVLIGATLQAMATTTYSQSNSID